MDTETLEGVIERITYYNTENGYSVLRLRPGPSRARHVQRDGLVTVVGNLPEINAGESLKLSGEWVNHPKHGMQFSAFEAVRVLPATLEGIKRYLGSGMIKGVGPRTAERIVGHFGEDTLDVIDNSPERLREVSGIGREKALMIHSQWQQQKAIQDVMIFLQGHGITTGLAVKIFKQYGNQATSIVEKDPYQLARDIWGVGFKTADMIAQKMGLPPDAPTRLEAGVVYALDSLVSSGHVYSPQTELVEHTCTLLGIDLETTPAADLAGAIEKLERQDRIYRETSSEDGTAPAIYLTPFYMAETGVARRLNAMLASPASRLKDLQQQPVAALLARANRKDDLSEMQLQALERAIQHKVSVITGGPGTGKTTALQTLVSLLHSRGYALSLASPTGRAARRLSEASGHPAQTIHKLLGYQPPNDYRHDEQNPLPCDILIVDEASMIDLLLMNHLLKALPPESHLVLVGDADQLPAVGAGDVLRNIIESGRVPVTRLGQIFRQAHDSYIVENAHRVNRGEMPRFETDARDFFLFEFDEPGTVAHWVIDVVQNRIPRKFGLEPVRDIQVLAPMYRGPVGVHNLNEQLQAAINPPGESSPERQLGRQVFRVGDKVMQLRNNYDKDVFNGDIGRVLTIDGNSQTLRVDFEGNYVEYDWLEADELTHAFAISVHKSQGSEYPAVVLPLVTQHYMMLQRNLLYTAITRARELCVVVGSKRALGMAVRNDQVAQRYTRLVERLQVG